MASWLPSFDFSFSLGRNVLVGVSIGLGIGIGIGAGMAASRKMFSLRTQDQKLVVHFAELANEVKELRCVMVRLEVCFNSEARTKRMVSLKGQSSARESDNEETEDDEFYEMSGESESLLSAPVVVAVDELKAVIDEVDGLYSSNNSEHKYKLHGILQESLKKHQQSCELTWRYARSCYDIATLKGKNGDDEGKKSLLYEGIAKAEKAIELDGNSAIAHKWYAIILGSTTDYESLQNKIMLGFKYKEHIQKAIELDRNDPSCYHLLGRWCYEVKFDKRKSAQEGPRFKLI